jgi:serine/threonine protein kinase/WD40 repeat protein
MRDDSVVIRRLAEEFLAESDTAEEPNVEAFAARNPALADRIRALFPVLAGFRAWRRGKTPAAGALSLTATAPGVAGEVAPGRTFNHYHIERELGRGGMGVVYEAIHLPLGKRVALKILLVLAGHGTSALERFLREARTAAALHHTNIIPVFDIGESGGLPYFGMEYIDGLSLDRLIAAMRDAGGRTTDTGPLAESFALVAAGRDKSARYWQLVAEIGAQAADGLAYAHERGVVHRDIKPPNLLLDTQGGVWVADFGLARKTDDPDLTQSGALLGTPRYMSPEQAEVGRKIVDHRTDIYSLGATLYELLTLRPPFDGDNPVDVLLKILDSAPSAPRKLNPAIPRDLETMVRKAMARRPEDRYQTAREFGDDLRRWLRGEAIKARPIGPLGRLSRWCRRNPMLATVSAAALAVVLTLTAVFTARLLEENARTHNALEREQEAHQRAWQAYQDAEKARGDAEKARRDAEKARADAERKRDEAEAAREQTRDSLVRSAYERARALNASTDPARRWTILESLRQAEQLRSRPRTVPPVEALPTRAELRSQAVAALLQPGARLTRQNVPDLPMPWAVNPNGHLTLQAHLDKQESFLSLVESLTGEEKGRWKIAENQIQTYAGTAVALNPEGNVLATTGGVFGPAQVSLWSLSEQKRLRNLEMPGRAADDTSAFQILTFSRDGRFLTGHCADAGRISPTHQIWVWDLKSGNQGSKIVEFDAQDVEPVPVFSSNSQLLAVMSGLDRMLLWDLVKGEARLEIRLPGSVFGATAFDPEGHLLAIAHAAPPPLEVLHQVTVWDLTRNTRQDSWLLEPRKLPAQPVAMAVSPDSRYLGIVSQFGDLWLHDLRSGAKLLDIHRGVNIAVHQVTVHWKADGRGLITSQFNGPLMVWELSAAAPYEMMANTAPPTWSLSAGVLGGMMLAPWPASIPWGALGIAAAPLPPPESAISVSYSPDGEWLALSTLLGIQVVSRKTGQSRALPGTGLYTLFSPDSRYVAAYGLTAVGLWEVATGRELAYVGEREVDPVTMAVAITNRLQFRPTTGHPMGPAFFPSLGIDRTGRVLVVRYGQDGGVWDLLAGKQVCRLGKGEVAPFLSTSGVLLVDAKLNLESLPTGQGQMPDVAVFDLGKGFADGALALSPDGGLLATGADDRLPIPLPGFINITAGALNPRLVIWKVGAAPEIVPPDQQSDVDPCGVPKLTKLCELQLQARATAFAFSPDNKLVAVAYPDGLVQVWDIASRKELFRWQASEPPVLQMQLMFSPDGKTLAGCDGRTLQPWRLDIDGLRQELRAIGLDWGTSD